MKRPISKPSPLGLTKKQNTGSSDVKSEIQELPIFRGTPRFEDGVLSIMSGISSALGHIYKAQEVLLDKIELIAVKVETLQQEVQSMKAPPPPVVKTNSPDLSWLPSDLEIKEWLNSPMNSPERICSPDLTCSETPFLSNPQSIDLTSTSSGSSDSQEWVNQDWHISSYQKPT